MELTPSTAAWVVLVALIVVMRPWQRVAPKRPDDRRVIPAAGWIAATLLAVLPVVFAALAGDWEAAGWWALAAPAAVSVLLLTFGTPIVIARRQPTQLADAGFRTWIALLSPAVTLAVAAPIALAAGADMPSSVALALLAAYGAWHRLRQRASREQAQRPHRVRADASTS